MTGIATAIVGGSIISGIASSKAASKSAKAQTESTEAGIDEQRRQFDATQESLKPFQEAGERALTQQEALLGLSGQPKQQAALADLEVSAGQKFLRARAQKNLLQNASAIGGLGGGNVRSALVQQGVGFAQQDLENQFARLGQVSGQGQAATTSVGQFGQQTAGNIANLHGQAGAARAQGIQQQNQAFQQSFGTALTGVAQSGVFNQPQGQTLPASNANAFTRLS